MTDSKRADAIDKFNAALDCGDFATARTLCETALQDAPQDAAWLTGAGNLFFALKEYDFAENYYRQAAEVMPQDTVALCNLAGLLYETGRYQEAAACAQTALERDATCLTAAIHAGNALSALDSLDDALENYDFVLKSDSENPLALFNKASVFMKKGESARAEEIYRGLAEKYPENADYLSSLATAQEQGEKYVAAAETYLKLLRVEPLPAWHITLGGALYGLRAREQTDDALRLLDAWLTAFPDNPFAKHTLETFSDTPSLTRASQDYVRELFDTFADSFDSVLSDLNYAAPDLVAAEIVRAGAATDTVLDLGCGTGLCGEALRTAGVTCGRLTGVDLSSKMLEKARERGVYDDLKEADILNYLPAVPNTFDTVLSSDVFTYLGDLSPLFQGVSTALKDGGTLIFTVSEDASGQDGYRLTPSGRYAHAKRYLVKTLSDAHLSVTAEERVVLRYEMGLPVSGFLMTARKKRLVVPT